MLLGEPVEIMRARTLDNAHGKNSARVEGVVEEAVLALGQFEGLQLGRQFTVGQEWAANR